MANIADKVISGNPIINRGATVNYGGAPLRGSFKTYNVPSASGGVADSITRLNAKLSTRFDDVNYYAGGAASGT